MYKSAESLLECFSTQFTLDHRDIWKKNADPSNKSKRKMTIEKVEKFKKHTLMEMLSSYFDPPTCHQLVLIKSSS